MENQVEKEVEHQMRTGLYRRVYRDNGHYQGRRSLVSSAIWHRVPQKDLKLILVIIRALQDSIAPEVLSALCDEYGCR